METFRSSGIALTSSATLAWRSITACLSADASADTRTFIQEVWEWRE